MITIAIIATAKVGGFIFGSIVHEVAKLFGVGHETAKASCLLIKGDCVQESPEVSPSNALVLFASQSIIKSSSSRVLVTLSNNSSLESQLDMLANNLFSITTALKLFAYRYLASIIALIQSATSSLIIDIKEVAIFFGSVSERVIEKNGNSSPISCLFQMDTCWLLLAKIILILKEATCLFMSRAKQNVSSLLGQLFPVESQSKLPQLDLLRDNLSVDNSIAFDVITSMMLYLTMVITYVKRALTMRFGHSWSKLQLHGAKVSALTCLLLFLGIFVIGWNTPFVLVGGSKAEEIILQQPIISLETTGLESNLDLEALTIDPITPRLASLSGLISDSLILADATNNDLYSVSTVPLQANDPGSLDEYPIRLPFWSDDYVSTSSLSQGIYGNDKTTAVSQITWNIDPTHYLPSGAALETSLFIFALQSVAGEVHRSCGFATKHVTLTMVTMIKAFDGCIVSVNHLDETFSSSFIAKAGQDQFSLGLPGRSLSRSVSAEFRSYNTPMITEAGPPRELSVIQYPPRTEFDGSADSSNAVFYPFLRLSLESDRISALSQVSSMQYHSNYLAQHKLSLDISPVSIGQPKISQFGVVPPPRPSCSVRNVATPFDVLKLRHFVLMMLLLVHYGANTTAKNDHEAVPVSEVSPTNFEEAHEEETTFADEGNGAEEALLPITNAKPSRRVSKELHSELGRHWKSPSKRRRRRSSRTSSRPKYYEPA